MAGKKGRSGPVGNLNAAKSVRPALRRLKKGKPLPPELAVVEKGVEKEAQALIRDKGGESNMTAAELSLVQNWKTARVAICLILNELVQRGIVVQRKDGWDIAPALKSLGPFLAAEKNALLALGLERREKNALSLDEYIRQNYGGDAA